MVKLEALGCARAGYRPFHSQTRVPKYSNASTKQNDKSSTDSGSMTGSGPNSKDWCAPPAPP